MDQTDGAVYDPTTTYDPTNIAAYDEQNYNEDADEDGEEAMIEEDEEEEEEEDDYDPSSFQFNAPTSAPPPAEDTTDAMIAASGTPVPAANADSDHSTKPAAQQRRIGGFVDDDDDDEEDTPMVEDRQEQAAGAEVAAAGIQARSVTQTPVNITSLSAPDTRIDNAAQDQGASADTVPSTNIDSALPATNGAASTPIPDTGVAISQTPTVPVATSTALPLPKARLPQDRVGILEDRIKDDPRGDTDAWLSLIEEFKQRNKIEEVYETYEKFLAIFPQAVSCLLSSLSIIAVED